MVNRVLQKRLREGRRPLGRMVGIGGCGFAAFHWHIALRGFTAARRSDQEFDHQSGTLLYPRSM
eukprot:15475646-Alexandrium_andersonii.AAC.1